MIAPFVIVNFNDLRHCNNATNSQSTYSLLLICLHQCWSIRHQYQYDTPGAWLSLWHMHLILQQNANMNSSSYSQQQEITQYHAIHNTSITATTNVSTWEPNAVSSDDDRDDNIGTSDRSKSKHNQNTDHDAKTGMSRNVLPLQSWYRLWTIAQSNTKYKLGINIIL